MEPTKNYSNLHKEILFTNKKKMNWEELSEIIKPKNKYTSTHILRGKDILSGIPLTL